MADFPVTPDDKPIPAPPHTRVLPLVILAILVGGCSQAPELPGGTRGTVRIDGKPLAEIQVTLFREPAEAPVAFAITRSDGQFELRALGTLEAAWLTPGEYRVTVESVGEHTIHWPAEYRDPRQTPLRQIVIDRHTALQIELPSPRQ